MFVDRLTKMVHFKPTTSDLDTAGFAELFVDAIVRAHGVPAEIISDWGPQFASELWQCVCTLLKVKVVYCVSPADGWPN